MADYNVTARFEADAAGYIQAVNQAKQATEGLGDSADKAGKQTGKAFEGADKSVQKTGTAAEKTGKQTDGLGESAAKAGDQAQSAFDGSEQGIKATGEAADATGQSVEGLGESASQAGQGLQSAMESAQSAVTNSASRVEQAKQREVDAIQRVRDAEQQLNTARQSGDQDAVIAASANLAQAKQEAETATRDLTAAEQEYASAADRAAAAQAELDAAARSSVGGLEGLGDTIRNNEQEIQAMGGALTAAGAGLTAFAVGATTAAIDWETAWAGVQKTNDGTSQQMQQLEDDLRGLATTLPATHAEVAATAEMAGQLGVAVDDVAIFTETMIHLGETTNLSAEEAATSLARFSNITGTSFSDVDKLGSAIVGLGNNFATTESEILHMSQRISAAGSQAGLSEGEIMGLATAMSSVGIEAEAGGTAMTQTFNEIDGAVREGGEALDGWAELAGTTADEFATTWREQPADAIDMVVQGLAQVNDSGGDVAGTLDDLGIKGIRQADVMRRLASASDIAGDAMAMGNEEFEKNSALTDEAAMRYETAASQIQVAWNNIKDAAITAGSSIAPVVGDIAEAAGDLAGWFSDLPEPVTGAVTAISGIAGVAALGAGGLALLAPRAVETWDAFQRLRNSTNPTVNGIKDIGKAAGVTAGVLAGLMIIDSLTDHFNEAVGSASEFETELRNLASGASEGAAGLDELFASRDFSSLGLLPTGIRDLDSAINSLDTGAFMEFLEEGVTLFGLFGDTAQDLALEGLGELDTAMSNMVGAGDLEGAAAGFRQFADAAEEAGWSTDRIAEATPEYTAALQAMASEHGYALEGAELYQAALGNLPPELQRVIEAQEQASRTDELTGALEDVGIAADGAVESLSEYLDLLFTTGLAVQSHMQAQASYEESLVGVQEAIDQITDGESGLGGMSKVLNDAGDGFDVTTEAGRLAQAAFIDVASSGQDLATSMADAGKSQEDIQGSLQGTYDDLIATAGEFGITGEAAEELARDVLGIPDGKTIETWMEETAQETANELGASLDAIPEGLNIIVDMDSTAKEEAWDTAEAIDQIEGYKEVDVAISEDGTAGQVQSRIDSITGKEEYVFVTEDGTTTEVQEQIVNIDGVNRTVYVDDDGTIYGTQQEIEGIEGGEATVDTNADTSDAEYDLQSVTGRPWLTSITGVPYMSDAENSANTTARERYPGFTGIPRMGNAENTANTTARERYPGFTGIPRMADAEGAANTTARERYPGFTGIPRTATAERGLNDTARDRDASINASKGNDGVSGWLSNLIKPRTVSISAVVKGAAGALGLASGGIAGGATGVGHYNDVPKLATGGRLPYTGLGQDMILGRNRHGVPTAWVDDGEWVVREQMSRKYHQALGLINADHPSVQHLAHLADGGQAGRTRLASQVSTGTASSIDYARLAEALGDRRNVTYQANMYNADAAMHDAMDGFQRMDMEESRR